MNQQEKLSENSFNLDTSNLSKNSIVWIQEKIFRGQFYWDTRKHFQRTTLVRHKFQWTVVGCSHKHFEKAMIVCSHNHFERTVLGGHKIALWGKEITFREKYYSDKHFQRIVLFVHKRSLWGNSIFHEIKIKQYCLGVKSLLENNDVWSQKTKPSHFLKVLFGHKENHIQRTKLLWHIRMLWESSVIKTRETFSEK